jgi:hypothetical protein
MVWVPVSVMPTLVGVTSNDLLLWIDGDFYKGWARFENDNVLRWYAEDLSDECHPSHWCEVIDPMTPA